MLFHRAAYAAIGCAVKFVVLYEKLGVIWLYVSEHILLLGIAHSLTGEGDSVLCDVNVLNLYLYDIARLKELGGVLDISVAHLGDVKKTVVVNADINEATEVNDVSYGAVKLHTGLEVVDIENVGGKDRSGSIVTNISAGLFKLLDNIVKSRLAAAKLLSKLCKTVLSNLESEKSEVVVSYVIGSKAEAVKKLVCNGV